MRTQRRGFYPFVATAALALAFVSVNAADERTAVQGTVSSVTFSAERSADSASAVASVPIHENEKLGWVLWIWDDAHRSDPGQTFRLEKDTAVTGISILIASAENLGGERFHIEFEGFDDIEVDVAPATERLATYRGQLPDDFDRQAPGKWVTFRLSRPMKLKRGQGYAFRFGFDKVRDYDLRRAFIRATSTDDAGQPRSAVPGRLTRQYGDGHYLGWGSVEDMIFILQTDPLP